MPSYIHCMNWCLCCACAHFIFCCCYFVLSHVHSMSFSHLFFYCLPFSFGLEIFIISFYLFITFNLHREPIIFMRIVNLMMILAFFVILADIFCVSMCTRGARYSQMLIRYEMRLQFSDDSFLITWFVYGFMCGLTMVMNK